MSSLLCSMLRGLTIGTQGLRAGIAAPVFPSKPLLALNVDCMREQVRLRSMRASRRIRGYPRPLCKGVVRPEPMKYGYRLPKPEEYTTEPLRIKKLAGRHPETGRVVVRTIGGGTQKWAYWIDYVRDGPESGPPFEEKVYELRNDGIHTTKIALVANGIKKRWIIATEGLKEGDIIRTTREIPRMAVRPRNGDAHPLGALPPGTVVHCVEKYPKGGAYYCRAAGTNAEILRKVEGRVIVQIPSKLQVSLSEKCLAVVGQCGNVDRLQTHYPIGSPNRLRRLGHRPRSGFWHRKDGYCGRKIKAPPPIKVIPLHKPKVTSDYVL